MSLSVVVYLFFLLLFLVFLRLNTAYHPRLMMKKHVVVQNPVLSRLLIADFNPEDSEKDVDPENQNKLLWLGLVFYILWIALLIFSLVMLFLVPTVPIEAFEIFYDWPLTVSTLNEKILWFTLFEFFSVAFALFGFNIVNCEHSIVKNKLTKALWIAVILLMIGIAIGFPIVCWRG